MPPEHPSASSQRLPLTPFLWVTGLLLAGGYAWLMKQEKEAERPPVADSPALLRMRAFEALMDDGPHAIPELIEQLSSKEVAQRRLAVTGLGRLGCQAKNAVPALMSRIDDEDSEVRSLVLYALASIHSELERFIPEAIQCLSDPSGEVRLSAARLLMLCGPAAASATIAALREGGPGTAEALQVLRYTSVDVEETREALQRLRADPQLDQSLRVVALRMLLAIGDSSIDEVGEGLSSSDGDSWRFALQQVSSRESEFAQFSPFLQEHLTRFLQSRSRDAHLPGKLRDGILPTLSKLGPSARPAIPAVESLALDDSLQIGDRLLALMTLHQIGADCSHYTQVIRHLKRRACDERLSSLSDLKLLANVVSTITPEEVADFVDRVLPMMDSPDPNVRGRAYSLLGQFGPAANRALPVARACLSTGNEDERGYAARLIATFGLAGRAALPDLIAEFVRRSHYDGSGARIFARAIRCVTSASESDSRELFHAIPAGRIDLPEWVIENEEDRELILDAYRRILRVPNANLIVAEELIRLRAETDQVIRALLDNIPQPATERQTFSRIAVAIRLLEFLGPRATEAIAPLTGILEVTDKYRIEETQAAMCALQSIIGSPEGAAKMPEAARLRVIEALLRLLQSDARRDAADTLAVIGPSARSALPALEKMLAEDDFFHESALRIDAMAADNLRSPVFRLAHVADVVLRDDREATHAAVCRAIERISGRRPGETDEVSSLRSTAP